MSCHRGQYGTPAHNNRSLHTRFKQQSFKGFMDWHDVAHIVYSIFSAGKCPIKQLNVKYLAHVKNYD